MMARTAYVLGLFLAIASFFMFGVGDQWIPIGAICLVCGFAIAAFSLHVERQDCDCKCCEPMPANWNMWTVPDEPIEPDAFHRVAFVSSRYEDDLPVQLPKPARPFTCQNYPNCDVCGDERPSTDYVEQQRLSDLVERMLPATTNDYHQLPVPVSGIDLAPQSLVLFEAPSLEQRYMGTNDLPEPSLDSFEVPASWFNSSVPEQGVFVFDSVPQAPDAFADAMSSSGSAGQTEFAPSS